MNLTSTYTLNNGVSIPIIGLGTFQTPEGKEVEDSVRWALDIGYRHIDTASFYENEDGVGKAIADSGVNREDIFLTTKVWNTEQGYEETLAAFDRSRKKLRSDIIDLYLVHWPIKDTFQETWKAMEKLYADGKVRAIGVSNFLVHHIEALLKDAEVVPAVNQVEWHPFVFQRELLDFCRDRGIRFEAWSPLTRGRFFGHETIKSIAEHHGKSPAQILIRWDIQHEVISIPKSTHRERIRENSEIFDFELSREEMEALNAQDKNIRIGPHPDIFAGWKSAL